MPGVTVGKGRKKLDYTKYLYYVKGTDVVSYNKSTKSKTVLQKNVFGKRKPKHMYFVSPTKDSFVVKEVKMKSRSKK